jgi:hypothetical protein
LENAIAEHAVISQNARIILAHACIWNVMAYAVLQDRNAIIIAIAAHLIAHTRSAVIIYAVNNAGLAVVVKYVITPAETVI